MVFLINPKRSKNQNDYIFQLNQNNQKRKTWRYWHGCIFDIFPISINNSKAAIHLWDVQILNTFLN